MEKGQKPSLEVFFVKLHVIILYRGDQSGVMKIKQVVRTPNDDGKPHVGPITQITAGMRVPTPGCNGYIPQPLQCRDA